MTTIYGTPPTSSLPADVATKTYVDEKVATVEEKADALEVVRSVIKTTAGTNNLTVQDSTGALLFSFGEFLGGTNVSTRNLVCLEPIYGGLTANTDLKLHSTTDPAKGKIVLIDDTEVTADLAISGATTVGGVLLCSSEIKATGSVLIPANASAVYGFTGNPTFGMSCDGNCICLQAANSRLVLLDGNGNTFRPSNPNSGAISLGRTASKWDDLFLAGDIKCDGAADIGGDLNVGGTLVGGCDTGTGWGFYQESTNGGDYSKTAIASPGVKLTCDGLGGGTFTNQLPKSGHQFWNTTTSLFEPEFDGDAYSLELRITANNAANNGYFELQIRLGDGGTFPYIFIPLGQFTFAKGAGDTTFSKTTSVFCRNTFKATGGTIFAIDAAAATEITAFDVFITRTHKAR